MGLPIIVITFPNETMIYDMYGRVMAIFFRFIIGTYEGSELPTGNYRDVVSANDKLKWE